MVRAVSACCLRGALLALVLVVCAGRVSSSGGLNDEGGEIVEDGVKVVGEMTERADVTDAGSKISERSVSGVGGVTDKRGMSGAGGVASEDVVDADDTTGDYNLIESNTPTPMIVTGEVEWTIIDGDEFVKLSCPITDYTVTALEDVRFPHFNDLTQSANLAIWLCPVPRGSYADVLAALHYRVADLKQLNFFWATQHKLLQASHFIKLPVEALMFSYNTLQAKLVTLDPIILEPLLNLTKLGVANVILMPMPASSRLRAVSAVNGRSWSVWGGCDQLELLSLTSWEVRSPADASSNWLVNCTKLKGLVMIHQSMSFIMQIMQGVNMLPKALGILNAVPYLLMNFLNNYLKGLEKLVLRNNKMDAIVIDFIPTSLKHLELSNNDVEYMSLPWLELLRQRPALRALVLDNTPLSTEQQICNHVKMAPQLTLQQLSLSNTGTTRLCFGKWFSLQHLDLRNNNITTLELLELPSAQAMTVEVDLRGNPISSVPLAEEGYNTLLNKFNKSSVRVLIDSVLNCDCEHAWFARALRSLPNLRVEDPLRGPVRCSNGKPLVDTPAEQLECTRVPCEGCVCRRAWSDNATVAHCGGDLRTMPRVPGLRALHAAGNRIKTLQVDDLPETLLMLDISDNQILRLNESVVNKLFSVKERRLWVAGNPFECDCENRALLAALKQHHTSQVADYSSIVCVGSKKVLDSVDVDELCATPVGQIAVTATLVVSGVLVALAALTAAVYFRYERPLRIFLYARGLCLCCMQEDGSDDDRPFDAFVSFAHEDEHLVTAQLLPGLELAPHSYKLCVHFRDWEPGELIPTQIRLSVERSRRTVIVLSRNFLHSMWAMLEFRTAHVSALSEGRVRIVVIVLDDVVDDERLDAELQGYLRTHTYLRWGDPWFWDKLRYALPRRRTPSTDDAQHPAPQRAAVTGNVNLSLRELQPEGTPDAINLSPNEFQPVNEPRNGNMSPHELQPVSAPGNVNLLSHEIRADSAPGDVNLSPHELQPISAPSNVNLSQHEL